jgi:hypothetical protein
LPGEQHVVITAQQYVLRALQAVSSGGSSSRLHVACGRLRGGEGSSSGALQRA